MTALRIEERRGRCSNCGNRWREHQVQRDVFSARATMTCPPRRRAKKGDR